MAALELHEVSVGRDGDQLLDAVDLAIDDGERLVVLGPSGSGKTSLLRTIAGLEAVTSGRIHLHGRDITHLPARERDVALVDQEAALQPHLDVAANLAFPLRVRGVGDEEIDKRVQAESGAFSLRHLLRRRPRSLSHGERHEVALARSLVRRSSLLLIDEPFARVDVARRERLLRELSTVQAGYGLALLLTTNDQRTAMRAADRMAVLDGGRVVQVGEPRELFERPANVFIAAYVGEPPMNLFDADLVRVGGRTQLHAGDLAVTSWSLATTALPPQRVTLGIRPGDVSVEPRSEDAVVRGVVQRRTFAGNDIALTVSVVGQNFELRVRCPPPGPEAGEVVRLGLPPRRLHVFGRYGDALAHGA